MKRLGIACVLAAALAGCFKTTITAANGGGPRQGQDFHHGIVLGLVELGTIDLDKICGKSGPSQLDYEVSFLNGLVGLLTFQIYTPVATSVTCVGGGGASTPEPPSATEASPPAEGGTYE